MKTCGSASKILTIFVKEIIILFLKITLAGNEQDKRK